MHDDSDDPDASERASEAQRPSGSGAPEAQPSGAGGGPAARRPRLPSLRASALLAAAMLGIGVAVGAAIGPAPESSFAGSSLIGRLPALIAAIEGRSAGSSAPKAGAAAASEEPSTPRHRRRRRHHRAAVLASAPATSSAAAPSSEGSEAAPQSSSHAPAPSSAGSSANLPAATNVWLIQLAGTGFQQALEKPSAAPYIDGTLVPGGTLLSGWNAVQGGALASSAAAAVTAPVGSPPPVLRAIVQPPCPEGAAGASCAPETAGQLTAADEFLKATLAQITGTAAYREHGLVIVTFATVGIAAQAGLPAGASTATLTSQPPAGVVVMSPFAHAGTRSNAAYEPTSPVHSLERLLHR